MVKSLNESLRTWKSLGEPVETFVKGPKLYTIWQNLWQWVVVVVVVVVQQKTFLSLTKQLDKIKVCNIYIYFVLQDIENIFLLDFFR